ncbi:chlamydia 15 kDa cysteine-rich outer membrane family protein, partial [Chlamydia psittaci 06-1683]
RFLL